MCMTFGCNSQIRFCYFFRSLNLVIFKYLLLKHRDTRYLVNATPPTLLSGLFFVTSSRFEICPFLLNCYQSI